MGCLSGNLKKKLEEIDLNIVEGNYHLEQIDRF